MTRLDEVRGGLARSRVPLTALPTPLHRLPRFSAAVGAEIWIKRDDAAPLALAGNKVRKLEQILGDARDRGCDVLLAQGAPISNVTRATAAAAAAAGLGAVLVLAGREPETTSGNLLLSGIVGARLRFTGVQATDGPDYWGALGAATRQVERELIAEGRRPYPMPVGCSSPRGVLGFVAAYAELLDQLHEAGCRADVVYHPSSSAGTHAGLTLGRRLAGHGPRVRGVLVADVYDDLEERLASLIREACGLLGGSPVTPEFDIDHGHLGPAYGEATQEALDAIVLLARTEGVMCDPVYTGKALAALIADVRAGREGPCIFWHTGGVQGVFEPRYARALWDHIAPRLNAR